ncbi:MAG: hypothetical protein KME26_27655 [Oscillatoria princeps RMCB-10]|jgi:hypothetical protein|nr:hypothetical protein [Oscillatoria princeps RMCB-10]
MTQVQSTDEIRQIQMLMAMFLCLSPESKLREFMEASLQAAESQTTSQVSAITDTSADGLKTWLESLLAQGGLTEDEQKLVDWQNNSDNMSAAIKEFVALQDKLNIKLSVQTKS